MTRYVGLRELCVLNNNQKVLNRLHFSWLRCPLEDPFLREYATREPRRRDLTPQKDDKPSAATDSASFYIIFRPHSDLRTRASAVPARPITRLASKPSKPVRSCTIFCCPPSVSTTFHMYSPRCVFSFVCSPCVCIPLRAHPLSCISLLQEQEQAHPVGLTCGQRTVPLSRLMNLLDGRNTLHVYSLPWIFPSVCFTIIRASAASLVG